MFQMLKVILGYIGDLEVGLGCMRIVTQKVDMLLLFVTSEDTI